MIYFIYIVYALVTLANGHGNDGKEVQYSDIVTFLEELHPDLEATKLQILLTNASIPDDMRNEADTFKLLVQNELDDVESITLLAYQTGLMDFDSKRCILKSYSDAIEAQMFNDDELKNLCTGEKYHLILTYIYSDLENIEEAAKNMLSEFLKANLWCSTNFDTQECYEASRRQVISNSSKIVAIIERAQKIESKTVDDFNNAVIPCLERAIENLDAFDAYVKQTIENCVVSPLRS